MELLQLIRDISHRKSSIVNLKQFDLKRQKRKRKRKQMLLGDTDMEKHKFVIDSVPRLDTSDASLLTAHMNREV